MVVALFGAQWHTLTNFDDFSFLELYIELFTEEFGCFGWEFLGFRRNTHFGEFRLLQFDPSAECSAGTMNRFANLLFGDKHKYMTFGL